jgi:GR25 family glycosyltransferase involved in LPS biosynthesis
MNYTIQVLTLRHTERISQIASQAKTLGLEFNFCFGLKGSELTTSQFNTMAPKKLSNFLLGRELGKNELACVLGHLKIYKKFLEDPSVDWCLVLEDDALISPQIVELLDVISKLPSNSVIHLSQQKNLTNYVLERASIVASSNEYRLSRVLDFIPGTYGYLIDRQAAGTAVRLSQNEKFYFTADWPLTWIRNVDFWVTDEILCSTNEYVSDIAQERKLLENKVSKINLVKRLSTMRRINLIINGIGISAIYGRILGIPVRITYRELFLIPLKRRFLKYRVRDHPW